MSVRSCSFLVVLALAVTGGTALAAPKVAPKSEIPKHQPMVFFVAKGGPNACGVGCSEWISAEGTFDPDSHKRLREFLKSSPRKNLPIFFNSPGGELEPALIIGALLREQRMTAGVAQTIPEGCSQSPRTDEACRKLTRSGREFKAQLRHAGAICASGCAYALLGASARTIAPGARLGVHANRLVLRPKDNRIVVSAREFSAAKSIAESRAYERLRQYTVTMGVDSSLIDLAKKTPHERVHWLSRDEMTQFGILPGNFFETRWSSHVKPDTGYVIVKSVTRPSSSNPAEYLVSTVQFSCHPLGKMAVSIRRELANGEHGSKPVVRISAAGNVVAVFDQPSRSGDALDLRSKVVPIILVRHAAASDAIVFREVTDAGSREIKLSTQGLSEAMKGIPDYCGAGRV
jgi:hypothetical protein